MYRDWETPTPTHTHQHDQGRRTQQNPNTQNIPVILLTAKVQTSDRARFAQLGVAGIIAKPFEPLKIADQIAELLKW